jgi:phospholipid transport system substrate-binding protein
MPMRSLVRRLLRTFCVVLALLTAPAAAAQSAEPGPQAVVAAFQDALLATMKEGQELGFEGRYRKLLPAIEQAFDIKQMTRIVVGSRWRKLAADEQASLVATFREFSVSTYAGEFVGYDGEQFETVGERPHPGVGIIVETRLVLKDEAPIALDYLLRQTPVGWQIVDVYLAGTISELARRRDEFASIMRQSGVAGLIAALKRKSEELARS